MSESDDRRGSSRVVLVTFTVDDPEVADALGQGCVAANLAACAKRIGPISSAYRWEGELEQAEEWQVVLTTTEEVVDELVAALAARHPYELPEILVTDVVGGLAPYLKWVGDEVRSNEG